MRLELTRRKPALPPQSSVSTNSTTYASLCAQNRTRTCTIAKPLAPETSASTNSATWAFHYKNKAVSYRSFSERKTGLEPATLTLARLCSTN